MAKENNVIKAEGYFDGQTSKGNFDVQLKAKFAPGELSEAIQFIAALGRQIKLMALINRNKEDTIKLGLFNVSSIKIDQDGNCKIVFRSNLDSVHVENFSKLMVDEALITYLAKVVDE